MMTWSSLFRALQNAYGLQRITAFAAVFICLSTISLVSIADGVIQSVAQPTPGQMTTFLADARPTNAIIVAGR